MHTHTYTLYVYIYIYVCIHICMFQLKTVHGCFGFDSISIANTSDFPAGGRIE